VAVAPTCLPEIWALVEPAELPWNQRVDLVLVLVLVVAGLVLSAVQRHPGLAGLELRVA
jgi:hypothetical protein